MRVDRQWLKMSGTMDHGVDDGAVLYAWTVQRDDIEMREIEKCVRLRRKWVDIVCSMETSSVSVPRRGDLRSGLSLEDAARRGALRSGLSLEVSLGGETSVAGCL